MDDLMIVGLAGFAAAFVDGALGMGFGPTSSSILLSSGISPAGVSATVNIAKVVTGLVSGVAHWRFGNIDRQLVLRLAVPGMIGAVVGTYILTSVDGDQLRPFLAMLLILIGLRILLRFRRPIDSATSAAVDHEQTHGVEIAGAAGGVTNGLIGAWGPVVTPFLLHRRIMPRIVVGSVNTAEVAVAFVAAGSLLTSASTGIDPSTVAAMLIGGVIAAPVAAWSVRFLPARVLGLLVAGLLLLTNARELAGWAELGASRWGIYAAVATLVIAAGLNPRCGRSTQRSEPVGSVLVDTPR
jgi:uncharacterized membrane protein YfcA